jgi:pimeloyl-ACP methyl ester carboxylesterase
MAILGHNTYDRLPEIEASTLVVAGTADMLIPPEKSRILAERIPGAKLVKYEGNGHGFFSQSCEAATRDILEFLR